MITAISHISLLVHNQEEALEFYTTKLGFVVLEDNTNEEMGFRWITIAPSKDSQIVFTLMTAESDEDKALVGKQAGSIPFCVLLTNDCRKTAQELKSRGVTFIKEPTDEFWGVDALLKDLYGNVFDLCEPANQN